MSADGIQRQWQAVLQPERHATVAEAEKVSLDAGAGISLRTAWWLAQCCHVVYVRDTCRRQELFARAGLLETAWFNAQELHWSRIENVGSDGVAVIAFRGSSDPRHWAYNLSTELMECAFGGKAHQGFQKAFKNIDQALKKTLETQPLKNVFFTGHSLGAALALLAATRWPKSRTYTFGSPRVGDAELAGKMTAELAITRVIHGDDVVTTLPEETGRHGEPLYTHAGTPLHITRDGVVTEGDAIQARTASQLLKSALLGMVNGQVKFGAPAPAFLDHAPEGYVESLAKCLENEGAGE